MGGWADSATRAPSHFLPLSHTQLTFTIASENPTVADARNDGADKLGAVQIALERTAPGAPIKTAFLNVQPVSSRPKEAEPPRVTSYKFNAGLTITLNASAGGGENATDTAALALAAASAVDAALAAGGDAVSVSSIQFKLSRAASASAASAARALAAADATTTAREAAAALGLRLGAPRSVSVGRDGGSGVVPLSMGAMKASAVADTTSPGAPTPLRVSDAETAASVEVVYGACEA